MPNQLQNEMFQISSEKNEEEGDILKISLSTTDESFVAEIWKLQLKLTRQWVLKLQSPKVLLGFRKGRYKRIITVLDHQSARAGKRVAIPGFDRRFGVVKSR